MRISPFRAAMTISNVASISIMSLSRAHLHRDFLFEADRMISKILAAQAGSLVSTQPSADERRCYRCKGKKSPRNFTQDRGPECTFGSRIGAKG
jgi:hypothetical protein